MLVFVCYSLPPEQLILAEGQANTIQGRSKIYFSQMAYPANPGYVWKPISEIPKVLRYTYLEDKVALQRFMTFQGFIVLRQAA